MSKTKVIAFANNKGGSGKTTTCSNVACALALDGKKVLMIDGDMQLNLTISYFDEEKALSFAAKLNILIPPMTSKNTSTIIIFDFFKALPLYPHSNTKIENTKTGYSCLPPKMQKTGPAKAPSQSS